jgi:hypothetical protein
MSGDDYNDGYDCGKRAAIRELQPLVDAITDAIFMFNEVSKFGAPKRDERFLREQFLAMGKQLDRCLRLSGIKQEAPPK